MRVWGLLVIVPLLAALLPTAARASRHGPVASVVLDVSITGIRPGMTPAQVRHRLGRPSTVGKKGSLNANTYTYFYGHGPAGDFTAFRAVGFGPGSGRVFSIITTSARDRTARGFGVGSRLSSLRRAYRLTCTPYACLTRRSPSGTETRFDYGNGGNARVLLVVVYNQRFAK